MLVRKGSFFISYLLRNFLTTKDMFKHGGLNICGKCHAEIYRPKVRKIFVQ